MTVILKTPILMGRLLIGRKIGELLRLAHAAGKRGEELEIVEKKVPGDVL